MEVRSGADESGVHRFVEVAVSLQGTLETFALPDVLVLLSSTKKTGELKVVGARGEGRVWVDKGQIVHSQNRGKEAAAVDTIFELLRLDAGTFAFVNDAEAPRRDEPQHVDIVLSDAQGRLSEWRDIERVVPHLDAVVDMAANAPGDEVTLSGAQWKLLVAVAGGRDVHTLMERMQRSEFDTCKAVKEIVEAGMATIDATPKAKVDASAKADEKPAAKPEPAKAEADAAKDAKPAEAKPADAKPEPAKADAADAAAKSGDGDELGEQLGRARRVRATTSGQGGADAKSEPARVSAMKEGESAPLPTVGAAGNGKSKPAADLAAGENDHREDDTEALVAQLAALGVDEDDPEAKAKIAARLAEEAAASDGEEPINRGLLLKFLSSVRN